MNYPNGKILNAGYLDKVEKPQHGDNQSKKNERDIAKDLEKMITKIEVGFTHTVF